MGHGPSDGIATGPADAETPCEAVLRARHRRRAIAGHRLQVALRLVRARSASECAISAATIISSTDGTRTSATTSWIFGAARAARSSIRRRAGDEARRPDREAGRRAASRSVESARAPTPPPQAPHPGRACEATRSPRAAAPRTRSRPPRPQARWPAGRAPAEISPRTVAGLRPAAVPTASRSRASGSAASTCALRRRAVRSSSASGVTNPAAGSATATTTASLAGNAGAVSTAAAAGAHHDAQRLSRQHGRHRNPLREAGLLEPLRDSQPERCAGERPHPAAAERRRQRPAWTAPPPPPCSRPPPRGPRPPGGPPARPAEGTAQGSSVLDPAEPPDRRKAGNLKGRRRGQQTRPRLRSRQQPAMNPGSISSANSAAPAGIATTSRPVNRACAVAERASAADPVALRRRARRTVAAGPRGRRRAICCDSSAAANESTRGERRRVWSAASPAAVDAPSSRSARRRASSAAGGPSIEVAAAIERGANRAARRRARPRPRWPPAAALARRARR